MRSRWQVHLLALLLLLLLLLLVALLLRPVAGPSRLATDAVDQRAGASASPTTGNPVEARPTGDSRDGSLALAADDSQDDVAAAGTADGAAVASKDPAPGGVGDPGLPALFVLGTLPLKERAPNTGYSRRLFGPSWADEDHNGCDTRNDVLRRDLTSSRLQAGGGCRVASGRLRDPYTGKDLGLEPSGLGDDIEIDHVVSLSDAWQTGALTWTAQARVLFANDPLNLLAVGGDVNREKGDSDAAGWLPPSHSYRCPYVARQVAVKAKYGLWVTGAEKRAMLRVLSTCPSELAPPWSPVPAGVATSGSVGGPRVRTSTRPTATPRPRTTMVPPPIPVTGIPVGPTGAREPDAVYYPNCAAARRAGAAPIRQGQPGYRRGLDRDHDGVACE